jgi:hypothetical protein
MNPLALLTRRFPRLFGLEWIEDDLFVKTDKATYDMRPVLHLSGGYKEVALPVVGHELEVRADERETLVRHIDEGVNLLYGSFVRGTSNWRLGLADHLLDAGYRLAARTPGATR